MLAVRPRRRRSPLSLSHARGRPMRDNTIGISRAALSHEQSIPPFCSTSSASPRRCARRIHLLLESGPSRSRAAVSAHDSRQLRHARGQVSCCTYSGVECDHTVPRIQCRRLRWIGKVVWCASSIEPYPSNMFEIYIFPHCTAMGGVPGASMEVQCLALRGHLGLTKTTFFTCPIPSLRSDWARYGRETKV